jgi:DNA mismatch repair protein MutL
MLHIRHADQRVRFERISKEFKNAQPHSQRLLIPHPLEFEPLASEALKSQLKQLNKQGFQIEEFGRNFYRIEAVPTWLSPQHAESFIRDLVDLVRQRGTVRKQNALNSEVVARLAVEGSYRSSDSLTRQTVEQLLHELLACETPHTSPFGKPTFSEVSWSEWERRFGNQL